MMWAYQCIITFAGVVLVSLMALAVFYLFAFIVAHYADKMQDEE